MVKGTAAVFASLLTGAAGIKTGAGHQKAPAAACGQSPMSFYDFREKYKRTYKPGSKEYHERMMQFNMATIHVDSQNCNGKSRWKAGLTHLADWTDAELMSLRGDLSAVVASHGGNSTVVSGGSAAGQTDRASRGRKVAQKPLPTEFTWAHLESIKADRDQGQCGSCWAFAADTTMRANAEIRGLPHKFAVSQVVSCMPNPEHCGGSGGCHGASAQMAMEFVALNGYMAEDDFAYPEGGGSRDCPANGMRVAPQSEKLKEVVAADGSIEYLAAPHMYGREVGLMGYTRLAINKLEPMQRALVEVGPVAVSVAAGFGWNIYWEGIMSPDGCDKNHVVNHAVTLFGYGTEDLGDGDRADYWHMKNSWGLTWGENGNLRLERPSNEESMCFWDEKPQSGSGCNGGPSKVWVCGSCSMLYNMVQPQFAASQ